MKKVKQLLSGVLCFAMVLGMIPSTVLQVKADPKTEPLEAIKTLDAFWAEDVVADNQLDEVAWKTEPLDINGPSAGSLISFDTLSTYRVGNEGYYTVSADGKSVAFVSTRAVTGGYGLRGTVDTIDHSKDMLLTQTVNVAQLPAGANPYLTNYNTLDLGNAPAGDPQQRNGYDFWICDTAADGTGSAVFCSMYIPFDSQYWPGGNYNGQQTLHLRIQGNDGTAATPINLGKKVNEVFELAVLWKADGSVTVSVDGEEKGSVTNGTLTKTALLKDNDFGMRFQTNGNNPAEFVVSNMSVGEPSAASAPYGDLRATWNKTGLTLGVTATNTTDISVSVNGAETKTVTGAVAEMFFPWEEVSVILADYNQQIPVEVTLSGTSGSTVLSAAVINTLSQIVDVYDTTQITTNGDFRQSEGVTIADGIVTLEGNTYLFKRNNPVIDHTKNILLTQTIKIDTLSTVNEENVKLASDTNISCKDTLNIWIVETAAANGSGNGIFAAIYSTGDGENLKLKLLKIDESTKKSTDVAVVDLGKKLGETFKLSLLWNADNSAAVFVDGEEKAFAENATLKYTGGLGGKITYYQYLPNNGKTMKCSLSDIYINHMGSGQETVIDSIKAQLLIDLAAVNAPLEDNLVLPEKYTDAILGDIPLTWQSSNNTVLEDSGEIHPSDSDATVTLTAKAGEKTVNTWDVTVKASDGSSPLMSSWSTSITDDDNLNEAEWRIPGFKAILAPVAGAPKGKLQAVWNKDGLMLGVTSENATSISVSVNGNTVKRVDAAKAEIFYSWAEAGVTLTDFNQPVPVTVTLQNAQGTSVLETEVKNSKSKLVDIFDLAQVTTSGNFLRSGDVAVADGVAVFDADATSGMLKRNNPLVDHSKNVLLVQTLKIDSLPIVRENNVALAGNTNISCKDTLNIWIVDVVSAKGEPGGSGVFASIYSTGATENLKLKLLKIDPVTKVSTDVLIVDLGKKLGETFNLGLLWNADDSAAVYVDGVAKATVDNATLIYTNGLGAQCTYYNFVPSTGKTMKASVSNIMLGHMGLESDTVVNDIKAQLLTDLAVANTPLEMNLVLPAKYTDDMLGDIPLTWESTNNAILEDSGEIHPGVSDTTVKLVAKAGQKTVHTWDITVKAAAAPTPLVSVWSDGMVDDDKFTEYEWNAPGYKTILAPVSGAPKGELRAVWNKDGLMLGVTSENATSITVSVNGKAGKSVDAANAEIFYSWAEAGVSLTDFNQAIPVMVTLKNGKGISTLDVDVMNSKSKLVDIFDLSQVAASGNFLSSGDVAVSGNTAIFDADEVSGLLKRNNLLVDHSKNILLVQTLKIDELPTVKQDNVQLAGSTNISCKDTFNFWIVDVVSAKGESGGTGIFASIYYTGAGTNLKLKLLKINDTTKESEDIVIVDLGKKLGESFDLALRWNADDSAAIYVDGVQKGAAENATLTYTNGLGGQCTYFNFVPNKEKTMKASVSNIALGHMGLDTDTVVNDIKAQLVNDLVVTEKPLTGNLVLPSVYTDAMLGNLPLLWDSSNTTILENSGTVHPQANDTAVQLTAKTGTKAIHTWDITVQSYRDPTPLMAIWEYSIHADGVLNENGWLMPMQKQVLASASGAPQGTMKALWNSDGLVLAITSADASSVSATVNSKVTREGSGNTVELAFTWKELGISLSDYNLTMPVKVVLHNNRGTSLLDTVVINSISQVKDVYDVSKATTSGDFVYSGDITMEDGKVVFDADETFGFFKRNNLVVDHSKNMMLVQTLKIDSLPVVQEKNVKLAGSTNISCKDTFNFWMVDVVSAKGEPNGSGIFVAIYYTGDGTNLKLKLLKINEATQESEDVLVMDLGKKLGDTFNLAVQWNADNSATVYVDGIQKATAENATLIYTSGLGTKDTYHNFVPNTGRTMKATLSEIFLVHAGKGDETVINVIKEQLQKDLAATAKPLEEHLVLPGYYEDKMLGPVPLTWESSNMEILGNNGAIVATDVVRTATLTAKSGGRVVHTWDITVQSYLKAAPLKAVWAETINTDNKLKEESWSVPVQKGIAAPADGAPKGVLKALWNKNGLVLGIDSDAANITVTANGVTKKASGGVAEIRYTWKTLAINLDSFNQPVMVNVTLKNASGTAQINTIVINSVTELMDSFDLSQTELTGLFRRSENIAISGNTASFNTNESVYLFKRDNTVITHDKSIMLSQDLKINKLPVVNENSILLAGATNVSCVNTLNFWVIHKESSAVGMNDGSGVFAAIYSIGEQENLKLRILGIDAEEKSVPYLTVDLGKKLGETFNLSILWNSDNSVVVSVDGRELGRTDYGTLIYTKGLGGQMTDCSFIPRGDHSVSASVSNIRLIRIANGDETIADIIKETWNATEYSAPLWNLAGIVQRRDIPVPAVFEDHMLGNIRLTWQSSDPNLLAPSGRLLPYSKQAKATLSAWYDGEKLYEQEIIVAAKHIVNIVATEVTAGVSNSIKLDGVLNEDDWYNKYYLKETSTKVPYGELSVLYNRSGLYLGLTYERAETGAITLNGKVIEMDFAKGTISMGSMDLGEGVAEIFLPWKDLEVSLYDYGQEIPGLTMTLINSAGKANLTASAKTEINLVLTSEQVNMVQIAPSAVYASGLTCNYGTAAWDTNENSPAIIDINARDRLLDHYKDMMLVQTLRIDDMTEGDGLATATSKVDTSEVYGFWISDMHNATNNINSVLYGCIYRRAKSNDLWLRIHNADPDDQEGSLNVPLGRTLGETFTLSVLWKANHDAVVYVDGAELGTAKNVTIGSVRGTGNDYLFFRYFTRNKEAGKITLSDVKLVKTNAVSVLDEMDLLPKYDLSNVTDDVLLPSIYSSEWLGDFPIVWETSNPDALSSNGKVTPSNKATTVEVSAISTVHNEKVIDKSKITVQMDTSITEEVYVTSPDHITVGYLWDDIYINGELMEVGWALSARTLDTEGHETGKIGFQWDKNNLYMAAKIDEGQTAEFTINGKTFTVDLENVTVSGIQVDRFEKVNAYMEMAIPLTELGMESAYGTTAQIKASINGGIYEGTLELSDISWFTAHNQARPVMPYSNGEAGYVLGGSYGGNQYHGGQQIDDGYLLYDRYDPSDAYNEPKVYECLAYGRSINWLPWGTKIKNIHMEFDFLAKSLPVYDAVTDVGWNSFGAYTCYGLSFWSSKMEQGKNSQSIVMGILNTEDGLVFAALRGTGASITQKLNKQVGEAIRIGITWKTSGDIEVYVDGVKTITLENVAASVSGLDHLANVFNLIRNGTEAMSGKDNMEVEITNMCLGHRVSAEDEVIFATIRGENLLEEYVTEDLILPTVWTDERMGTTKTITWSSSNETLISSKTGKVTRPSTGVEDVVLTAEFSDGIRKEIALSVPGLPGSSGNVLVKTEDYDPSCGVGVQTMEPVFTLDGTNSSVIVDLGSKQKVNVIKLRDGDEFARLNEEVLTIWVSNNNETYTQVEDFKLLHDGIYWYLYDFEATGRYIKVHCTHFDADDADFIAPPAGMITAYYEEVFGDNGSQYPDMDKAVITNDDTADVYDHAWKISKKDLTLTGDDNSIRVYLGSELLYHYTTEDALYVRIPVVKAGTSVTLNILSGNDAAMDIANKEYVYEVTYGTREAWDVRASGTVRWIYGPLKDGTILGIYDGGANRGLRVTYSYDDGRSWTPATYIPVTTGRITGMGGFGYDQHTDTLYIVGYLEGTYTTFGGNELHIIKSKDQGMTWTYVNTVERIDDNSLLTYSNMNTLSSYDGEGPNVDIIFTLNKALGGGKMGTGVAYTIDAGKTWQLSNILWNPEAVGHEDGLSEATIEERENGMLVMYIRNQVPNTDNFAVSYSYDHGKTWTEIREATVYTVNTQPIFFKYDNEIMLSWGGNNMYGPHTRLRTPHSVAVTYDDMLTFENIQDLYVKYSLQGMTLGNMNRITNQQVVITEKDTFLSCWMNLTNSQSEETNVLIRVEDFYNFFYKTKNAYDSFENGTVKAEGWSITGGNVTSSDQQASDGKYSMLLTDNAVITRSIPYFQNGVISLDIYVEENATFNLDLQSAYTNMVKKGSPVGLQVVDNAITFYGAEEASGLSLQKGWNTLTFQLELYGDAPSATFSLNGGEAKAMPVNTQVGDYICYITPITTGTLYVDNVLVESSLDALNVRADKKDDVLVETLTLDQNAATVKAGETLELTATVTPDNPTDKTVKWASSDETIATVKDGVVTVLRTGRVTISASSGFGYATCQIVAIHNLHKIEAKEPTFWEDGNLEYYQCSVCHGTWKDEGAKQLLLDMKTVILPKTGNVNITPLMIIIPLAVLVLAGGTVATLLILKKKKLSKKAKKEVKSDL